MERKIEITFNYIQIKTIQCKLLVLVTGCIVDIYIMSNNEENIVQPM